MEFLCYPKVPGVGRISLEGAQGFGKNYLRLGIKKTVPMESVYVLIAQTASPFIGIGTASCQYHRLCPHENQVNGRFFSVRPFLLLLLSDFLTLP